MFMWKTVQVLWPSPMNWGKRSLDEKVSSMMEKSQNIIKNGRHSDGTIVQKKAFICKLCGKEGQVGNIRNHIEANHLDVNINFLHIL